MKLLGVQSAPSLASCKHLESFLLLQTILLTPQGSPRTLSLQVRRHLTCFTRPGQSRSPCGPPAVHHFGIPPTPAQKRRTHRRRGPLCFFFICGCNYVPHSKLEIDCFF